MNRFLFIIAFTSMCVFGFSQHHLGFHTDNYAGIYNLGFQPADIVDSRFQFDMNLFYTGFSFSNNYVSINRAALFDDRDFAFDDPNFQDNYLKEKLNGKDKSVFLGMDIMPPLSFSFNFKQKNALALSYRARFITNVEGVSENLARNVYNELDIPSLLNIGISNEDFSIQSSLWAEAGVTYGREVINLGNHYVKAAGTFKLTSGMYSTYMYSDNLEIIFPSDSTVSFINSDILYSHTDNFDFSGTTFKYELRPGVGFDFGAVYEWRPDIDDYKYELNGDPDYIDPRKNKYKLKVGFAIVDIGNVRFKRSPFTNDIYADRPDIPIEDFEAAISDFGNTGWQGLDDTLNSKFVVTPPSGEIYRMRLPMSINLTIDYRIWKPFYLNGTLLIGPRFRNDPTKTRVLSEYSITPRIEHKWASVFLPLSVDALGNFHFGLGFRAGPLFAGTNDILPLIGKDDIYSANLYVGLRVPIHKKIKDKDKDHVTNKFDNCVRDPGTWATNGCPDSDLDGLTDEIDQCPTIAGPIEFNGCPDTDEDGIEDRYDECPAVAGVAIFNGCPDTDEDGIQNKDDDCPEVPGLEKYNGCPDSDKDGIQDKEDDCPFLAGLPEFNGCPDTDGDGITDLKDNCPDKAGPADNGGCPYNDSDQDGIINPEDDCPSIAGLPEFNGCPDTDEDGVEDKVDKCPLTPGVKENDGCPKIEEEIQEVIDVAFDNLEFESGKAIIRGTSYESLQQLAKVLKDNPDYTLRIAGHTDNVGSESSNLTLSEKRANAVKTYLMQYNLAETQFVIEAYGESRPIATNETAAGRALNRRVEMELVFD